VPDIEFSNLSYNQKKFLKHYREADFNISEACINAELSRAIVYVWLRDIPEFKDAFNICRDEGLDLAESALIKNIKKGISSDIQFMLKYRGRLRGYGETIQHRHEIDIIDKAKKGELTIIEIDEAIRKEEERLEIE
jgi:predicted DNA-binding protein YlxM (UPF0122 family)